MDSETESPRTPDSEQPSVVAVIPVLNEESAIGHVVGAIPRDVVAEVVVVDGGSRDATIAVAQKAGARVVIEQRRGYGRACATGVVESSAEVVVFLDGVCSDDAAAIERVAGPLLRGDADLVLGVRVNVDAGALPVYARLGNAFAAAIISRLWRQRVSDLPSYKAIRRCDLAALGMTEATYGWTIELIVKSARRKLRIREIPIAYHSRIGGISKVSGNPSASLKAAISILRVLARHGLGRGDVQAGGPVPLV